MSPEKTPPPGDTTAEVSALIETLHETGQRLEELTGGEVDTVADRRGRPFMLRRAQDHVRNNESAKQAAILNALPAHIALLDSNGVILSVNEAWRPFAASNSSQCPRPGIGLNYLDVCDNTRGQGSTAAHRIADGIRSVLAGKIKSFSIEYPCHSLSEQTWFLMTAIPLNVAPPNGAVIMHVNVTAERQTEESLRTSELRFRQVAENIRDLLFLVDVDRNRLLYISAAYERIWGRSCESLYANPASWIESIHPDDRESTYQQYLKGKPAGTFDFEYRIVRPDGSIRWIKTRGFPVRDDAGKISRITGVAEDITERKGAEQAFEKRTSELERFHRLSVGRELRMIELKQEVNVLAVQTGQSPPYKVSLPATVAGGAGTDHV